MQDSRFRLAVVLIALIIFIPATQCWAGDDAALIYKTKCAVCHGADGLSKQVWARTSSQFPLLQLTKSRRVSAQHFRISF